MRRVTSSGAFYGGIVYGSLAAGFAHDALPPRARAAPVGVALALMGVVMVVFAIQVM